MGRNLNELWKHAEKIKGGEKMKDGFKCNFCHKTFAGGIARLKSHLAGIKGRDIGICDKVEKEVRAEAFLAIKGPNKKAKRTVDLIVQDDGSNDSSSTEDLQQSAVSDLSRKKNKGEVDHLLVKHFISNNIAFNVIETSPFQEFVRSVAAYGPDYEVPSYSTLERKLIADCMAEVDEYIKDAKKKWVTYGCTLICDVRFDIHQRNVLNIVAYSSGGAVFIKSSVIGGFFQHGQIKDIVSSVIEDIGPHQVVQIITKNTGSDVANKLIGKYPWIYKINCAADGTEHLLEAIYMNVQWVREVIDNAKLIVRYMYKHTTVLSLMRQYTDNRELKHPCNTRFASNFKMLQSLLDVESELWLLIVSSEWGGLDYNKEEKAKVTSIIQNSNFWSQGREVLQALEPIVQVLRLVEGEGSTSGYLYEAMEKAKDTSRELCHNNEAKYKRIWELFEFWREERIVHPIHAAAAFLNPSYMCSENFKEDSKMKNGIDFMLENLVSDDERHSFMQQIHIYRAKVSSLFTVTAKTMLKTSHPRVWWDYCGDSLPILKKYAIRILSQPCSFSSFKQSWNTFEASQTKMRNRFTPHILNNFVQVRMNMLMMAKFNSMETQDLLPIDLEKLRELPEYVDPPEEDWEHEVTNSTQQNLNHDTGMCIATGYTGDGSVIGNVAHQYGGDGGGGFEGNEGSSSQAIGFSQTQAAQQGYTEPDIDHYLSFDDGEREAAANLLGFALDTASESINYLQC